MKTILSVIFLLTIVGICNAQTSSIESDELSMKHKIPVDTSLLEFYRQYSSFTDPGEYGYLYEPLTDSLPELCRLIKSQFIHPFAELHHYHEQIPEERWNESIRYPTVISILAGLVSYDARGLVDDRKPADRLVLGCRDYAILLASILKYRGIPARVRCGHAAYLRPGFHLSHTICEVWNENEGRWMLVDPGLGMIDFSADKFDFSNELWLKMQKGEIDTELYGLTVRYSGFVSITAKVYHDLASILGTEYPIYHYAPVLDYAFDNDSEIPAELIETLNRISELMKSLDAENHRKLQEIYNKTPEIQVTRSYGQVSIKTEKSSRHRNN